MSDQDPVKTGHETTPRKRSRNSERADGASSGQKRDKYTVVACNDCRKRKIKCTGDLPCRRCESYDLRCAYAQNYTDTGHENNPKSKIAAIEHNLASLRAQVEQLSASMKQMQEIDPNVKNSPGVTPDQTQAGQHSYNSTQPLSEPTQPRFIGPTSSAYNFIVANKTLQMMGIQPNELNALSNPESTMPSRCSSQERIVLPQMPNDDPLCSIAMEEIYRALDVYQEELDPIYPFVPLAETVQLVPSIYNHLAHKNMAGLINNTNGRCCAISDKDIDVLKLMVSNALILEGRGKNSICHNLVNSVHSKLSTSASEVEVDLKGLRILTMTSIYQFHCDEPVLAWRTIGFAARIAIEIGLHRRESLEQCFPEYQDRQWATRLFWCIYILDRRWSFGTGMPFALQDSDIDPDTPHLLDSEPYLKSLVAYGRLCSKVWSAVAGFNNKTAEKDTVSYLDFQIQQWLQSIPEHLQLLHPRLGEGASSQPRGLQRLRVLLYIRGNQMRGFVHRHNILSASNIAQNPAGARLATDIAKDTINVLVHLKETSTIYDTQQSAFNYFLVSAISAIFLAVCHAPAEFSHSCRYEFYRALNLLKDLSAHSYISQRLWKSVRGLRSIAPKLGLAPNKPVTFTHNQKRAHPNASNRQYDQELPNILSNESCVLRYHHTRYHHTNEFGPSASFAALPDNTAPTSELSPSKPNMVQMGNELTDLYEFLDNYVVGQQPPEAGPDCMNEGINALQSGMEISRLFEGLL